MTDATPPRSVGRPREFDEDAVLEAAMHAFWRKGYEATSLTDLCNCTGLHKGSLYQSFGDKHTLFLRSLKHYAEQEFREVAAAGRKSDSPLENIRNVVWKIWEIAGQDRGCLVINSIVELAPHDPEVRAALKAAGEKRVEALRQMIQQAQQAGEIRRELDARRLAGQLMVTLAGAAATVKGFMQHDDITQVIDDLIESWT